MSAWLLYALLLRATVLSFSGFASLPVVRDDLVLHRSLLTDEQLNAAVAISQTSPGPLGLYVVIVGYFVGGTAGACAGMAALATPAFLAIPLLRLVRRQRSHLVRGASNGIIIASSVLMLMAAARLAFASLTSPLLILIAVCALALLAVGRVSPVLVVALSALVGLLLRS